MGEEKRSHYPPPEAIQLPQLECRRCGHEWVPRLPKKPARCPRCGSIHWDEEPQKE